MSWLSGLFSPPVAAEVTDSDWSTVNVGSWRNLAGGQTVAGVHVDHAEAMNCATAFACTRALAETLATLPPIVYRDQEDGVRQRASNTDAWNLLHDTPCPSRRCVGSTGFYDQGTVRIVNRGNAFAEIQRDGRDRPIGLWPVHPSRVRPWVDDNGDLEYHVYLDEATRRNPVGYTFYTVPARDMLNVVGFNSEDGVLAPGVVAHAMQELGLDIASQRYGSTWFGNGARPNGVVRHPGFIKNKDRRDEFRSDINRIHGGIDNWNKVGVLWEGAEWQNIEVSPEQAQFLGTRQWQAKVLCRLWNVPPAIVQIYDEFKFSSVDAMIRCFVMLSIRPLCVRWERAINSQVLRTAINGVELSAFDQRYLLEFALEALLRGDPETQAKADTLYEQWGVLTVDEIRRRHNLNPHPNGVGSEPIAPLNYTTLAKMIAGLVQGNQTSSQTSSQASEKAALAGVGCGDVSTDGNAADAAYARYTAEVLNEAYHRLMAVESRKARAAAADSRKFFAWMDEFYGDDKWPQTLAEALRVGVRGWCDANGVDGNPDALAKSIADAHCRESREQLLQAAESPPAEFVRKVASTTTRWADRTVVLPPV
jgi:HK97 family phage portal protein